MYFFIFKKWSLVLTLLIRFCRLLFRWGFFVCKHLWAKIIELLRSNLFNFSWVESQILLVFVRMITIISENREELRLFSLIGWLYDGLKSPLIRASWYYWIFHSTSLKASKMEETLCDHLGHINRHNFNLVITITGYLHLITFSKLMGSLKYDYNFRLKTLTVITLSGFYTSLIIKYLHMTLSSRTLDWVSPSMLEATHA